MGEGCEDSFKGENKLGLIDGMLERPKEQRDEEFTECHVWDMVNLMLCSWLLNIIDPKLQISIAYSEMTKIMWDDLKKKYGMPNTPKVHHVKANIASYKEIWVLECFVEG